MIAKQLITTSVLPLKSSDSAENALVIMDEYRVSHLPIVDEPDFLGVISDSDIFALNDLKKSIGHHNLSLSRAYVYENQHIFEVIKTFSLLKLTLLPVLDEKNHYLGIITLPDLVQALSGMAAIENPGGVIVLEVNDKDYVLVEIAQIVESNDAKILGMYITSNPDSTQLELTLKINRMDIGPVLQTFFRYNYNVKASWSHEDAYLENIQDRYDSLMNYLNI